MPKHLMQFTAQLNHLPQMIEFIRTRAKEAGFDETKVHKLELASEEAIVNIISYAYPSGNPGPIELDCQHAKEHFEIIIKDQGIPFDPLKAEVKIQKDIPPEERPIGGLGIYLMRHLMDEVTYQRNGNQNILKLILRS